MADRKLKAKVYTSPAVPFFNEETVLSSVPSFVSSELNNEQYSIFPGFCDVHVHFREPGFSYKETIQSGSRSAARGGYTAVCTMPNLNPVPDSVEHLQAQLDLIRDQAVIAVYPYGSITVEEKGQQLADLEGMAANVISFSDDGRGVQDEGMMREAMLRARSLGKIITAHCEVNDLLHGGYIHDGRYAAAHGHKGICSESEWRQIERDVRLAGETGCAYHVCHISCKESVSIIRDAKKSGVNVTCETGPHYLVLCEDDLQEHGRFRMNPPLRSAQDRDALLAGIQDGTIDMIATDHAPHSAEEKSRGLSGSAFGVVGLETAFPVLYTKLVRTGVITMDRLMQLLVAAPRARFGIPFGNEFSVWDLETEYPVDPAEFVSMGKATPFEGMQLFGKCLMTVKDGNIVW
ncbi:MAG: dihydroorotase [Oscillospiraceae bacterium]|nr:dihydroorotase [Oscillospiraceae bacterium]